MSEPRHVLLLRVYSESEKYICVSVTMSAGIGYYVSFRKGRIKTDNPELARWGDTRHWLKAYRHTLTGCPNEAERIAVAERVRRFLAAR